MCEKFGIFDNLYTDNGSSFAGHLVAGGNMHRFRNSGSKVAGIKPVGICNHLGINIRFALPGNAQAKIAERTFASLFYKPVSVNKHGQIMVDNWVYGSPGTQADLLPYHGTGKQILLGRDPDELSAPAIAFDENYDMICEGIEYVERGAYDSVEGIRNSARNRKAARDAIAAGEAANNYLDDVELNVALASLGTSDEGTDTSPGRLSGRGLAGRSAYPDPWANQNRSGKQNPR